MGTTQTALLSLKSLDTGRSTRVYSSRSKMIKFACRIQISGIQCFVSSFLKPFAYSSYARE